MAGEGLDWQLVQFPFAGGLDKKRHPHAVDPPALTTATNLEFDEVGAVRLRKPHESLGLDVYPSGSISSSDVRRLEGLGAELLLFTKSALYTRSVKFDKWVSRGEHLAVATEETSILGNTNDQVFVDRAQLDDVVVLVWTEVAAGATKCYLAAVDATNRATLLAPTEIDPGATASRPRVIAGDTVFFVLWVRSGTGLLCATLDPDAPAWSTPTTATMSANENPYDAVKYPATDKVVSVTRNNAGTSYTVSKVGTDLIPTTSTKVRTADGLVALSCSPAGNDRVQIIRQDGTTLKGDLLVLSTLADVYTGQAVASFPGEAIAQVTCAHRSVTTGGYYRCYVFWDVESATGEQFESTRYNWVDTNNSIGTEAFLVYRHGLASRAFDHGGQVYVWTVFAQVNQALATVIGFQVPLQNTAYLYREDSTWWAKAAWARAGGLGHYSGHLAGVALVSGTTGYAWATSERGLTELGGYFDSAGYGARSPRDVLFTFDDDRARRVVQLGRTAYVSGAIVQQYDGEGLTEVGFEQFPWWINAVDDATAGLLAAGSYNYIGSYRSENARGEVERSTTAIGQALTVAANRKPAWGIGHLRTTKKQGSRRSPAIELWRTQVNPKSDAPFYLVTSRDPSATGDNGYVANNATSGALAVTQRDNLPDTAAFGSAKLLDKEPHPEVGNVLPRFAPPPATILVAGDSRLFLAGIPAEPYRIRYSLLRNEGEVAGFHPSLAIDLPASTGAITALAIMDSVLFAATATACYAIAGDGLDNTGGGANYGPARLLSSDIGVSSHDTVALTPGGLVFFSRKGWYRLTRGWDLEYIGAAVESRGRVAEQWVAAQVVESQHQVRVLGLTSMLTWDYLVDRWSEWAPRSSGGTVAAGTYRDLAMWESVPLLLSSGVYAQADDYGAANDDLDVETGWIRVAGLEGQARCRWLYVLLQASEVFAMRIRIAYNYNPTYVDDKTRTVTPSVADEGTTVRHEPRQQRITSIRVRITIAGSSLVGAPPVLTGLALEVGVKPGGNRRIPSSRS